MAKRKTTVEPPPSDYSHVGYLKIGRRELKTGDKVFIKGKRGAGVFMSVVTNHRNGKRWVDIHHKGLDRAVPVEDVQTPEQRRRKP